MSQTLEAPELSHTEVLDEPETADRAPVVPQSAPARQPAPPQVRRLNVRETWMLAAWFGLVLGLLEAAWFGVQQFVLGDFIYAGSNVYWMSPVVQGIAASLFAVPFCVLSWRSRHCTEDLIATLFAFWVAFNVILLYPKLILIAHVILALGIAVQCGRWTQRRPGKLLGWARASLGWMSLGVVLIAATVVGLPAAQERWATAALPAPAAETPNVLLLVLDTVRSDALELDKADQPGRTPNLRRLAEESFVFEQAYSTSPWTLPSHASLMTGRLPHELSANWNTPLDGEHPTLAEWLRDRGYRTGGFVSNTWFCTRETGLDRGFLHYESYNISLSNLLRSTAWGRAFAVKWLPLWDGTCTDVADRRRADSICESASRWIERDDARPYFAFLNFFDAHDPYVAPPDFRRSSATTFEERIELRDWWVADKQNLQQEQTELQRQAYLDCVASLDYEIGRLLKRLQQSGHLDNTLVIVTSDHGEHFGEHELYGHGNSLYQANIHVPLMVWHPTMTEGTAGAVVSLRDLPATISAVVAQDAGSPFPGNSLARYWNAPHESQPMFAVQSSIDSPPPWPVCGGRSPIFRGAMKSVVWNGYKLIQNGDGIDEVYHLATDPGETRDLAATISPALLEQLHSVLE